MHKAKKTISAINNNIEANSINISKNSNLSKIVEENSLNLFKLENKIDTFIELQQKNNKIVEQSLKNTNDLINNINSQYVTKKQFDELVKFINKKKISKNRITKKKKNIVKRTDKESLSYAISLFNNNYLTKSKPIFLRLIKKNYKPAESNFYLAEILYYKKRYKDAIHYFKTSMMLYDQASYIPKLLLHSAISFEKLKDKDNAINFYSTLVDAYPETKEAIEAQNKLQKLQ